MAVVTRFYGTGRRKTSVARVRLVAGSGKVTVNHRKVDEYLTVPNQRTIALQPLEAPKAGPASVTGSPVAMNPFGARISTPRLRPMMRHAASTSDPASAVTTFLSASVCRIEPNCCSARLTVAERDSLLICSRTDSVFSSVWRLSASASSDARWKALRS